MGKIVYSMPEKFIEDSSVPVKWRLYGELNGFWLNGLTIYAANKHFADKLKCSERTISWSLAELEKEGLVRREIHGFKRLILPAGGVEEGEGATPLQARVQPHCRQGCNPIAGKGATPLQHNALSNAPSINTCGEKSPPVVISKESEEDNPKPEKRTKDKLAVYKLFSSKEQPWWRHKQQRIAALSLFDLVGIESVKNGLAIMLEHSDDHYCPQASTPFEYEEKREALKRYIKRNCL